MVRLEAEVKQITHAIRMAAYNAETTLARALDGRYARASDEAYALIREALTGSGDIIPGHGELLIRLDPLTAPRRTQALAALCDQLNQAQACYPGTDLVLRYEVKPHPTHQRGQPAALVAGQSWRVSMNTGICRVALAWYSPTEGYSATSFAHSPARAAPSSSSASTVNVWVPTSTLILGLALRL